MNDFWTVQLRARQIEEETGLSLADKAAMPIDEWSRLTYGMTPAQGALRALNAQHEEPQPPEPVSTVTATAPEPHGIDPDSHEYFMQWRANRVSGGEGGIFDSVSSQSDEYRNAARKHAGRTAMAGNRNTIEPPRIEGRYLRHDDQLDYRSAAQRLSNQANMRQGR